MPSYLELVEEALDPKAKAKGSTLVVQNHLAQMKMFTIRGGVELYPVQDDFRQARKQFIDDIFRFNKIAGKLDRVCDVFSGKGEVLIFFRPTKNGQYKIHFYEKGQYKVFYDLDGDMNKVVIVYSYKHEEEGIGRTIGGMSQSKWLRMTVTSETIVHEFFTSKPGFSKDNYMTAQLGAGSRRKEYVNSLKFLPCVLCKSYGFDEGEEGLSDFFPVRSQLEQLDQAVRNINTNLQFFGNSTLVTSRTAKEMLRASGADAKSRDSVSSRSGYSSAGWSSYGSNPSIPSYPGYGDEESSIARIFENIGPEDRMGYISPDPISPDHALHVRELREQIHFALGGIDELGISANATAYEMKTIYGKVATTAGKKAMALFDYGLCLIIEMMIASEEDLFRQSLALVMNKDQAEITDAYIQELVETEKMPKDGIFGLMPLGDRQIKWRYVGEVFEKSARDMMEQSIVVRNLQELGMSAKEALQVTNLFENKTHHEIEAVLSEGYPYRYVQSVLGTTQQVAGLYAQLLQLPDPNTKGASPLGAAFPVNQLIGRGLETIVMELNHQKQYDDVKPGDPPTYQLGLSNFNKAQLENESASTTTNQSTDPTATAAGSQSNPAAANAYGYGVQPSWGNQPGNGGVLSPEYEAQLPEPNTVVSTAGLVGNYAAGTSPATQQLWGPVSTGFTPYGFPTMEPIPDNSTNANRTTRKQPARRRSNAKRSTKR